MDTILSFGAGVQTTALAILVAEGKVRADAVVFADTGAEKPETYWYMETYTKPLMAEGKVPFVTVRTTIPSEKGNLYDFLWSIKDIPNIRFRRCTDHFKIRPIRKLIGKNCLQLIGFSIDEVQRAKESRHPEHKAYPLIEMGMSVIDARRTISDFGWPLPLKSSCFFCIYQPWLEWNWLKNNHADLFQKAIDLEARYYERKPYMRNRFGLLRGTGLWRLKDGLQPEMLVPGEYACWEGYCSH